jgi:hypothetical protein
VAVEDGSMSAVFARKVRVRALISSLKWEKAVRSEAIRCGVTR